LRAHGWSDCLTVGDDKKKKRLPNTTVVIYGLDNIETAIGKWDAAVAAAKAALAKKSTKRVWRSAGSRRSPGPETSSSTSIATTRCAAETAAAQIGASPGPAHGPHLAAPAAAAEEAVGAIGFEARHRRAGRHSEPLQHLAALRIDAPEIALLAFPCRVPELAVEPGDAGDEAARFDGAENGAGIGIDLVDLARAILPDPERPFRPGEAGILAATRRRDGREHAAGRGIDLLDAVLGDLEQVPSVEGGAGMRRDIDRAHRLAARRIHGVELVAGRDPDVSTVVADAMHLVDTREGPILADDLGGCAFHVVHPSRAAAAPGVTSTS